MIFPSYEILKIPTRQDRQLCLCRNCHATLGTSVKSVYSRFISLGFFLSSFALMTFFTFEKVTFWMDRCLHHLRSNRWIIGTKYSGMFSSSCRLILSQVNSSALRSKWWLMFLLHLGNFLLMKLVRLISFQNSIKRTALKVWRIVFAPGKTKNSQIINITSSAK